MHSQGLFYDKVDRLTAAAGIASIKAICHPREKVTCHIIGKYKSERDEKEKITAWEYIHLFSESAAHQFCIQCKQYARQDADDRIVAK